MVSFGNVKWLVQFTSANLCRGGRRGVWFHVLCGVLRTRNTFRAADSLWNKGNLCDYVDRAWLIVLFVNYLFICRLVPSQQSTAFIVLDVCLVYTCAHVANTVQNYNKVLTCGTLAKKMRFFLKKFTFSSNGTEDN